ncbi:hypothetical protein BGP_6171 [Beggiatoa sp. PS]|nr:hypothetical protein BGP_6171 [Beggiatoa sp. PS]
MNISGRTRQIQNAIQTYEEHLDAYEKNFANYAKLVEELGGYSNRFIAPVIKAIQKTNIEDVLILESLKLLEKHVARAAKGIVNVKTWQQDVEKMSLKKGVFIN